MTDKITTEQSSLSGSLLAPAGWFGVCANCGNETELLVFCGRINDQNACSDKCHVANQKRLRKKLRERPQRRVTGLPGWNKGKTPNNRI